MGHRIIEINGHSVVATPHARIIELLTEAHIEVGGVLWKEPVVGGV